MAIDPNGRILAAGGTEASLIVDRWLPNGVLDTSFGNDMGRANLFGAGSFTDVTVTSSGKILAAGTVDNGGGEQFASARSTAPAQRPDLRHRRHRHRARRRRSRHGHPTRRRDRHRGIQGLNGPFVVARYLENGNLDPTFGTGGVVTDPAGLVNGNGLALMPDGKIVVGGATSDAGPSSNIRVVRYDANGVLDPAFGCTAPPCAGYGDAVDSAIGISAALQADLKIVVVGTQLPSFGQNMPVVARFDDFEPSPPPVPPLPVVLEPTFTG